LISVVGLALAAETTGFFRGSCSVAPQRRSPRRVSIWYYRAIAEAAGAANTS
jgi:hypothetical protein